MVRALARVGMGSRGRRVDLEGSTDAGRSRQSGVPYACRPSELVLWQWAAIGQEREREARLESVTGTALLSLHDAILNPWVLVRRPFSSIQANHTGSECGKLVLSLIVFSSLSSILSPCLRQLEMYVCLYTIPWKQISTSPHTDGPCLCSCLASCRRFRSHFG